MELMKSTEHLLNISARYVKRAFDHELSEYGLTTSQWALLRSLSEEENLTQAELAENLHADRATAGLVLDKLIKKQYVTKSQHQEDRRAYCVQLTEKGRDLIKELTLKTNKVNEKAFKGLGEEDIRNLSRILNIVIENCQDEESGQNR